MKTWSNPVVERTFDEVVNSWPKEPYTWRCAIECVDDSGKRIMLDATAMPLTAAPRPGERIRVAALDNKECTVTRVAYGYPDRVRVRRPARMVA
jgi:hypothetical protein